MLPRIRRGGYDERPWRGIKQCRLVAPRVATYRDDVNRVVGVS